MNWFWLWLKLLFCSSKDVCTLLIANQKFFLNSPSYQACVAWHRESGVTLKLDIKYKKDQLKFKKCFNHFWSLLTYFPNIKPGKMKWVGAKLTKNRQFYFLKNKRLPSFLIIIWLNQYIYGWIGILCWWVWFTFSL